MEDYLWQTWLAVGILLMILEMILPGFVLFFFGFAALLMSLITRFVPEHAEYGLLQAVLFCALSLAGLFCFRNMLKNIFTGKKIGREDLMENDFIGKPATVVERVTPQTPGKVEFMGTHWRARSDTTLEPGASVTVAAQENLTLMVKPVE